MLDEIVLNRIPGFCSCGLQMRQIGTGLICVNCDTVQPVETICPDCDKPGKCEQKPGQRAATNRDYTYLKVWRQRILRTFPGQGTL